MHWAFAGTKIPGILTLRCVGQLEANVPPEIVHRSSDDVRLTDEHLEVNGQLWH